MLKIVLETTALVGVKVSQLVFPFKSIPCYLPTKATLEVLGMEEAYLRHSRELLITIRIIMVFPTNLLSSPETSHLKADTIMVVQVFTVVTVWMAIQDDTKATRGNSLHMHLRGVRKAPVALITHLVTTHPMVEGHRMNTLSCATIHTIVLIEHRHQLVPGCTCADPHLLVSNHPQNLPHPTILI